MLNFRLYIYTKQVASIKYDFLFQSRLNTKEFNNIKLQNTYNQIQKTKEKLSEETTDNDTTPLYIKVVKSSAIVLLIPCVIFFFLKLYFRYKG